ncbi:MAG: Abi family protein [Bacilli bacterium]|nr:Abi family protein [Bacilli bacterium]
MVEKHFRNLEEQIEILKNKGLKINNESYAKDVLLRENYFFLNGYRYLFMYSNTDKRFLENTTFEELYSMFLFDRNIRNIIFKNLLIIENNLKSIISYQLSKKYGYKERDYLKEKNFTRRPEKKKQVKDLISKMQRQIRINSRDHTATMHYADNYGYIPMWILVKVLSFGIVSEMYSILKDDDQIQIAKVYHVSPDSLITYLPILANYRNLCAHEDILFDNKTQKQIEDTIYHQLLNIQKEEDEYIYGKCDLFSLLIIMKELLVNEEFKSMIIELENAVNTLDYNLSTIKVEKVLHKMGFPLNWYELKNMERSYLNE